MYPDHRLHVKSPKQEGKEMQQISFMSHCICHISLMISNTFHLLNASSILCSGLLVEQHVEVSSVRTVELTLPEDRSAQCVLGFPISFRCRLISYISSLCLGLLFSVPFTPVCVPSFPRPPPASFPLFLCLCLSCFPPSSPSQHL